MKSQEMSGVIMAYLLHATWSLVWDKNTMLILSPHLHVHLFIYLFISFSYSIEVCPNDMNSLYIFVMWLYENTSNFCNLTNLLLDWFHIQ